MRLRSIHKECDLTKCEKLLIKHQNKIVIMLHEPSIGRDFDISTKSELNITDAYERLLRYMSQQYQYDDSHTNAVREKIIKNYPHVLCIDYICFGESRRVIDLAKDISD